MSLFTKHRKLQIQLSLLQFSINFEQTIQHEKIPTPVFDFHRVVTHNASTVTYYRIILTLYLSPSVASQESQSYREA